MTVASFTSPGSWSWSPPVSSPNKCYIKRITLWGGGGGGGYAGSYQTGAGTTTCFGTVENSSVSMYANNGTNASQSGFGGSGGGASGGNSRNASGANGAVGGTFSVSVPSANGRGGNSASSASGEYGSGGPNQSGQYNRSDGSQPGGGGGGAYLSSFGQITQYAGGGGAGCCESTWSNVQFTGTLSGSIGNGGHTDGVQAGFGAAGKVEIEYEIAYVSDVAQASYALSGIALILTWFISGDVLTAICGTYSYFGYSLVAAATRVLTAIQGSLTLTGKSVIFKAAYKITATAGSFILTGYDVANTAFLGIFAGVGSFVLSGQAIFLGRYVVMEPLVGFYSIVSRGITTAWNVFASVYVRNKNYILSKIRSTNPTLDD